MLQDNIQQEVGFQAVNEQAEHLTKLALEAGGPSATELATSFASLPDLLQAAAMAQERLNVVVETLRTEAEEDVASLGAGWDPEHDRVIATKGSVKSAYRVLEKTLFKGSRWPLDAGESWPLDKATDCARAMLSYPTTAAKADGLRRLERMHIDGELRIVAVKNGYNSLKKNGGWVDVKAIIAFEDDGIEGGGLVPCEIQFAHQGLAAIREGTDMHLAYESFRASQDILGRFAKSASDNTGGSGSGSGSGGGSDGGGGSSGVDWSGNEMECENESSIESAQEKEQQRGLRKNATKPPRPRSRSPSRRRSRRLAGSTKQQ